MTVLTVKVSSIEKNVGFTTRFGNKSVKHEITYERDDGSTMKEVLLKNSPVYAQYNTVEAGQVLELTREKDGQFWKTISVTPVAKGATTSTESRKTSSSSSTGQAKSYGYDSIGQQIGNCITNAVTSLGAGKTIEEYQERAIDLILMGNEIRKQYEHGALTSSEDTAAYANEQNTKAAHSYNESEESPF